MSWRPLKRKLLKKIEWMSFLYSCIYFVSLMGGSASDTESLTSWCLLKRRMAFECKKMLICFFFLNTEVLRAVNIDWFTELILMWILMLWNSTSNECRLDTSHTQVCFDCKSIYIVKLVFWDVKHLRSFMVIIWSDTHKLPWEIDFGKHKIRMQSLRYRRQFLNSLQYHKKKHEINFPRYKKNTLSHRDTFNSPHWLRRV